MESLRGHKRKISFADLEATFRRAGPMQHGPPQAPQAQPQVSAQQLEHYRLEQTRRADVARRQSKKPSDREIPDELADVIVGDGVDRYKKLRDVERRLDAVMMRKRLDITDNLQRQYTRREGMLRIWISNTAEGQPWQVSEEGSIGFGEDGNLDFGESNQATFRVKIDGRLLPDSTLEKDGDEEEKAEDKSRRPRLSHFFKSITIDFDRNPALQPDGFSAIEWRKPAPGQSQDPNSSEVSFDTLEFERKTDEDINVTINLLRDVKTERFKFSPKLAEILDTEEDDKAGAVQGIWEYCRAMGLQEDEDRRSIVCDEPLKQVCKTALTSDNHVTVTDHLPSYSKRTLSTSHTSRTCSIRTYSHCRPSNSHTPSASTKTTSTAHPPPTPIQLFHHPRPQYTTSECLYRTLSQQNLQNFNRTELT